MNSDSIVVLITVPSQKVGKLIARDLLEKRAAACVNIMGAVQSHYWWEDKIQEEEEILLIVKTRASIFETRLVPAVRAIHPYDTPEIIALPVVKGLESYLTWIEENVTE